MLHPEIKTIETEDGILCNIIYGDEKIEIGYKNDGTVFIPEMDENSKGYKAKLEELGLEMTKVSSKMWSEFRELGQWSDIDFPNKESYGDKMQLMGQFGHSCSELACYGYKTSLNNTEDRISRLKKYV